MPIPILLAGLGAVAGIVGAGGHLSAKETNKEAQRVLAEAQKLYNEEKASLERAQRQVRSSHLRPPVLFPW